MGQGAGHGTRHIKAAEHNFICIGQSQSQCAIVCLPHCASVSVSLSVCVCVSSNAPALLSNCQMQKGGGKGDLGVAG